MASRALSRACSNSEHVGGADRGPNLLAVGAAGDGCEDARTFRRHADVVAAQFGVGPDVAFPLARQRRHHASVRTLRRWRRVGSVIERLFGLTMGYDQAACYTGLRQITMAKV